MAFNWNRINARAKMARQGVDDITDQSAFYIRVGKPRKFKPRPSKSEMRRELERLMEARKAAGGG